MINTFATSAEAPSLESFILAVWPTNKSLIDPIADYLTDKGKSNSGHTIGSVDYGQKGDYSDEKNE